MAKKLSIIIPHYILDDEILDLAKKNLQSIRDNTPIDYEVVYVDNDSPKGSKWIKEHADVYVNSGENLGNPGGWNAGADAATGNYLCFSDNDVVVKKGWIEPLLGLLEDERVGIAFPKSWNYRREPHYVERLSGFCFVMKKKLFEDIGGFNEKYGLGNFEDSELFAETLERDLELVCHRQSKVKHYSRATTDKVPEIQEIYEKNEKYYFDHFDTLPMLSRIEG